MKNALVTGVTGLADQGGAYLDLSELLLGNGREAHNIKPRVNRFNIDRVDPRYFRPIEIGAALVNAGRKLGTPLEDGLIVAYAEFRQSA